MKPLSETYKELGIAFSFPIEINDDNGKRTYYEDSGGCWARYDRDSNGRVAHYGNNTGLKQGTPRPTTNQ